MTSLWPLQSECIAYYGNPAKPGWLHENTVSVPCPWTLHVGHTALNHILIHRKCADSLATVLSDIWAACGKSETQVQAFRFDRFDGSYNFRAQRGGSQLSMHAFACAIDWDAADNTFHSEKHLFTSKTILVNAFKEAGWIWGGDWSPGSIDAMHVQAARIHN